MGKVQYRYTQTRVIPNVPTREGSRACGLALERVVRVPKRKDPNPQIRKARRFGESGGQKWDEDALLARGKKN